MYNLISKKESIVEAMLFLTFSVSDKNR